MNKDVEHIFMYWPFALLALKTICSFAHSLIGRFLLFYCLIFRALYIFWILILHLMNT
jgi:hypothetical protein